MSPATSQSHKQQLTPRTVGAVVVHQNDFLQQLRRSLVDDAADGPFDDGECLIQKD